MKIIHTSDWHLGQKFYRIYDRDEEHAHFFEQLVELAQRHRPDALLVCGDVFDAAAPSNTAQRRLVEHLLALREACPEMALVLTAGNHDSASLIEVNRLLWQRHGVHVVGAAPRTPEGAVDLGRLTITLPGKGRIVALPHLWNGLYPSLEGLGKDALPLVVMAHMAVRGCNFRGHAEHHILGCEALIGNLEQRELIALGTGYDYLALGHIHGAQSIGPRARYCGSPIPLSFDEPQEHSVSLVEIAGQGQEPCVTELAISPLRGMTTIEADSVEEALERLNALPEATMDYLRVVLRQNQPLPALGEAALAQAAARMEQARYCGIELKRSEMPQDKSLPRLSARELRQSSPLEVARLFVEGTGGQLDEALAELFAQVVNEIHNNQ